MSTFGRQTCPPHICECLTAKRDIISALFDVSAHFVRRLSDTCQTFHLLEVQTVQGFKYKYNRYCISCGGGPGEAGRMKLLPPGATALVRTRKGLLQDRGRTHGVDTPPEKSGEIRGSLGRTPNRGLRSRVNDG